MAKHVVIVSYQFAKDNLRLQPWRYVLEMARRLPTHGWHTTILTDVPFPCADSFLDVRVKDSFPLSPFLKESILMGMEDISPDVILWPLGAKSASYASMLRSLKAKTIGYIPGPILTLADFFAACRAKLSGEILLSASWMLARRAKWGKIVGSCCEAFVVLSEANRKAMIRMDIDERRIHMVTAGLGRLSAYEGPDRFSHNNTGSGIRKKRVALYMGWPTRVRGIDLLLDAFAIVRQSENVHLVILARGEGTKDHVRLRRLVRRHPAREHMTLVEGFLPEEDVVRYISESDFGVLPFIQVPADRPLSFLDFFSAGKPVVATDATGIPELIGHTRGLVAHRGNPKHLATALIEMANTRDREFSEYRRACLSFIRDYPDWDESALQLARVLEVVC